MKTVLLCFRLTLLLCIFVGTSTGDKDTEDKGTIDHGVFTLVDKAGYTTQKGKLGLLLYKGGTVCDDYFSINSANVICHLIGYDNATVYWDSGFRYHNQKNYEIKLNKVNCTRGEWGSCKYSGYTRYCNHRKDVFLSCHDLCPAGTYTPVNKTYCMPCEGNTIRPEGSRSCTPCKTRTVAHKEGTECGAFTLVDSAGNTTQGGELGLLLLNGGTVCSRGFSINSANAICHMMGYVGAERSTSSRHLAKHNDAISPTNFPSITTTRYNTIAPLRWIMYDYQTKYEIKLSKVQCTRGEWGSCKYSEGIRACDHEEDVFLSCHDLCPAGTYLTVNKTYCMPCEGNTIRPEGSSSCTPCETRTVANKERTKCGEKRWRSDGRCGSNNPLPDGTPNECDPDGETPCCKSDWGWCGNSVYYCSCSNCVDYRVVKEIRKSGDNCAVVNIGGFLKNTCYNEASGQLAYKCFNSDMSYEWLQRSSNNIKLNEVSSECENDTHAYQACGFNTEITNNEVLCGGYICATEEYDRHKYIECENCSVDNRNCSHEITDPTICDDKCNDLDCEDESYCNGYKYGVTCTGRWDGGELYVPVYYVCTKYTSCDNRADKQDCNVTESTPHTCTQYRMYEKVPIFNYTRCSVLDTTRKVYPYCTNYLDQTNCTDIARVGGWCTVNGSMISISKYVVCGFDRKTSDNIELCDDGLENECTLTSSKCNIHKHKLCDSKYDCLDKSDEHDEICSFMTTNFTCQRRVSHTNMSMPFPLKWVNDHFFDCMNGDDENIEKWTFCGDRSEKTSRVKLDNKTSCKNVYLCPGFDKTYVEFNLLCDGIESCGMENEVCRFARDFPKVDKTATRNGSVLDLCKSNKGLKNIVCSIKESEEFSNEVDIFGVDRRVMITKFNVPTSQVNCNDLFGEYYVYLSCMNMCTEMKAIRLLNNKPLLYDSCPGQFPDRVNTLANNSYLTFVRRSVSEEYYYENYHQCNNGKCIERSQLCDLIDDCGDNSDEENCVNHMVCKNTRPKNVTDQLIPSKQKCDGIYDCFDLSDECNEECGKQILGHFVLKTLCWLMGILAVVFNTFTVARGVSTMRQCQTEKMLITKALVNTIGSGDLLIGVYLIVLSVYDSIVFGKHFCDHQPKWLTGTACSVLGVVSTIGSQLSVFAMTALSIIRAYGLTHSRLSKPSRVNKRAVLKTVLTVFTVVSASLAIALIPLLPALEDYFVQGMHYDSSYKIFIGFPNKERHLKILRAYFKFDNTVNQKNVSKTITDDVMTWKEIGQRVDGMFSQQYGNLTRNAVHFYGNDGVCLFKYFVRSDDARRSRQDGESFNMANDKGDIIVWLMLGVNLTCFILVTICYVLMNITVRRSSKDSGSDQNPNKIRENRQIQTKITIIIVTDFLCWVPFIIISALHNRNLIDATRWYVYFAMTVLPLNSVINPLIYDKKLGGYISAKIQLLVNSVSSMRVVRYIRETWQARREDRATDVMEMVPLENQTPISDNVIEPAQCQNIVPGAEEDIVQDIVQESF